MNTRSNLPSIPQTVLSSLIEDTVRTIFLSGSQFDGFGHRDSDIDLFIVKRDSDPDSLAREVVIDFIDQDRLDIEVWRESKLRALCDTLDTYARGSMSLERMPNLQVEERDLLYRILIGEPVYEHDVFTDLKAKVNGPALTAINYWTFYELYMSFQEDAVGLLSSGDLDSAMISCHLALEAAIDALLASLGENSLGSKWRFRKLNRHQGLEDITAVYRKFLYERPRNPEHVSKFIERYINVANDVSFRAQIDEGEPSETA